MSKNMKFLLSSLIIVLVSLFVTSCQSPTNNDLKQKYPSLNVVNQYSGTSIKSVTLVGYEFENLLITSGDSQLFALDKGMPGGYTGINIIVRYGSRMATWYVNKIFDFGDGKVTTITLKGSGAEGDPDYNNTRLE